MPIERSSAGDPARTLELLWREPGRGTSGRGPRQGRTVDEVVDAAIGIADEAGLESVTMRKVAQALGVVPMSLYTYVPGKAELLDLMLDTVYGRMPRTDRTGEPWRARVEGVARENRELFERHPWAARVSTVRPPLGPGVMAKYEHELAAFDGLGLTDVEMDAALTYLLGFVQTTARMAADVRGARHDSAMDDEQWWEANQPLLARVFDETRYPVAARVGGAAGAAHQGAYGPDHAYEFGLRRVLDGLGALIDARAGSGTDQSRRP
ncbi:AcrR family transcriptional regulator [Spinactinospora alkalitolerans]|uniref:AcrR family transcriptional regulator n=1 Tax=Spinactinospora alkalitolerans TaxID=687207 RepID=A0A852U5J2_9ACTN|nr:TetR/AcrR family transcriptional regulator C-terminal domain-containing protein [Spinactinospora alkalitolerans]NYE50887.1 AcrR family transcriptional regulator [Spinactinospora alkalitolerans]